MKSMTKAELLKALEPLHDTTELVVMVEDVGECDLFEVSGITEWMPPPWVYLHARKHT